MMTTAGRRPFSMREMRAARAGSGACALGDCGSGVAAVKLERLLAESLGENSGEVATTIAARANVAVRRSRIFVVADFVVVDLVVIGLVVVDFMEDLMGENRITFDGETIRLVG